MKKQLLQDNPGSLSTATEGMLKELDGVIDRVQKELARLEQYGA